MAPAEIEQLIKAGFPGGHVEVTGDGRHFQAVVVSAAFDGQSMIKQHRAVYAALGERFDNEAVHALSLRTYTPAQWDALNP